MQRILLFILAIATGNHLWAQADPAILYRLQHRYDQAFYWGKIYVVKANGMYAFADSAGRLKIPFTYRKFDTVLRDRALASIHPEGYFTYLVDEWGNKLAGDNAMLMRLVNKKKRLFAYRMSDGNDILYNDSGRQVTFQGFDASLPEETMMYGMQYTPAGYLYGVITHGGDTLLPVKYSAVSFGKRLYGCLQNDTAAVYEKGKGLIFRIGKVHGLKILANDIIAVQKYGVYAMVSRTGKLLTDFKYWDFNNLSYQYSMMERNSRGQTATPGVISGYALIGTNQPKGLIDSTGHEVFPMAYDEIHMNSNGWFIVKKSLHDKVQLLDDKQNIITEGVAYGVHFITRRYVSVEVSRNIDEGNDAPKVKTYDMVLRKFVDVKPRPEVSAPQRDVVPPMDYKDIVSASYNKDSMILNRGGTVLVRVDGKWGVRSVTGDVIVPFIYDTAGSYGYQQFYIGKNGRFAKINEAGDLVTPAVLPDVPWYVSGDSVVLLTNKDVYNLKTGQLQKAGTVRSPINNISFGAGHMAYISGDPLLRNGVYNMRFQRLADRFSRLSGSEKVTSSGIATVTDSTGRCNSLIDSNGNILVADLEWVKRFFMYDDFAVGMADTMQDDVLYRFTDGKVLVDTIKLAQETKQAMLYPPRQENYGRGHAFYGQPDLVKFVKPGYGVGYFSSQSGKLIFDKPYQDVKQGDRYWFVKTNGKWGVTGWDGREIVPAEYDTVCWPYENIFPVYRGGKMGMYDRVTHKVYQPVYDTILYPPSIRNNFFIARINNKTAILDKDEHVLTSGWDIEPARNYSAIGGGMLKMKGVQFTVSPTLSDTLKIVPDVAIPSGSSIVSVDMDGGAVIDSSGLHGVYDIGARKWLVPMEYKDIKKENDYYVAHSGREPYTTTIYSPEGMRMFTLNFYAYMQRIYPFEQWYTHSWYGAPVVNYKGKVIVPDTFKSVFVLETGKRTLYEAITKGGMRAIIDTSGHVMTPAVLDYVENPEIMYDGYFRGSLDGKLCLISRTGKMLTKCLYEEMWPGFVAEYEKGWSGREWDLVHETDTNDLKPYFIVAVGDTDSFGVIDGTGKERVSCLYDSIKQVHLGKIAVAKKGGKWGLVGLGNKPVTDFVYDEVGIFYKGYARFRRGAVSGLLMIDGKEEQVKGQ